MDTMTASAIETERSLAVKQAAFLLINSSENHYDLVEKLMAYDEVQWASPAYGPHGILVYVEADTQIALTTHIETMRVRDDVDVLDARMCKFIPGDEDLNPLAVHKPEIALLLINVDYKQERERDVTYNLRKLPGVQARAMWGPADIVAIAEADTHEDMRNLICDEIKTMRGVKTNTTLYCYPQK